MRDRPSTTAAFVAACRTLGERLPREAQLAHDPYGAAFAGPRFSWFPRRAPRIATMPFWPFVIYMQVRTRAIDDVLRRFLADGGKQILILGAGYDCRASRFADDLRDARVFEVDHPATQARKRAVLDDLAAPKGAVTYVAWDFEARPVGELPGALSLVGHDARQPTLTIWEGVTMYLTERAIEETVAAVRELSSAASPFVLTYFDLDRINKPSMLLRLFSRVVARSGEPFRFGWQPAALPTWMSTRGFEIAWDRAAVELARELLPPRYADWKGARGSHIALVHRTRDAKGRS